MPGWIAQVDNSVKSSGPMVNTDNLRRTMGGGTVHVRAETEFAAKLRGAAALGVELYQVTVTKYGSAVWDEVAGTSTS